MDETAKRLRAMLTEAAQRYPGVWKKVDAFRAARGTGDLPDWPDWCFLPIAASYAVVSGGGDNRVPSIRVADVGRLAALAAWRGTQGIYRFDPELYAAVTSTELKGDLPWELLTRLPAWGVYVEMQTPGLRGFFAHLEHDIDTGRMELRLVFDAIGDGTASLIPFPLHIGQWGLAIAVAETLRETLSQAREQGYGALLENHPPSSESLVRSIAPMVSLLLYLCSESADYTRPPPPKSKRTKRGTRLFAPDRPTTWDVGARIGAALRSVRDGEREPAGSPSAAGTRPRAHIRRAHWHTFWTGPLDGERTARVKWLPPIAVNVEDPEELPAVVHPVK